MDILIQIIGALGILASFISFQCKKNGYILFFRTLNEAIFAVQYVLLGAYTGMAVNLVGCVRNVIFKKQISKSQNTMVPIVIFSLLFIAFGIITWQGPKSILIIVAKVLSTIAYGNKNPTILRAILFITCSSWLIYNYFVFSIAGILCEAFTLTSLVIGVIRLDIIPRLKKSK